MSSFVDFLKFMGIAMGGSLGIAFLFFILQTIYEKIPFKFKELVNVILMILGIVIFIWVVDLSLKNHEENKEAEIREKVENICDVILYEQPNNQSLYDDCWNVGMEQLLD